MSIFFEMGRTNFILKKKKTATCHLEFLLFFTLLDGEFGFPLTKKDFMDPIPAADEEDPTRRRSGTMSPVRWSQWLGIHTRGFWYLQRSFSEEKNCTNLTIFFVNISHVTSWKHLYWIWIWSLNLKNHKILKLLVKLDSKILIWC